MGHKKSRKPSDACDKCSLPTQPSSVITVTMASSSPNTSVSFFYDPQYTRKTTGRACGVLQTQLFQELIFLLTFAVPLEVLYGSIENSDTCCLHSSGHHCHTESRSRNKSTHGMSLGVTPATKGSSLTQTRLRQAPVWLHARDCCWYPHLMQPLPGSTRSQYLGIHAHTSFTTAPGEIHLPAPGTTNRACLSRA